MPESTTAQDNSNSFSSLKTKLIPIGIGVIAIIVALAGVVLHINNTENIMMNNVLDGQVVVMQFTKNGSSVSIKAEAAVTQTAQEKGLMNRNGLASDEGMLFIMSSERYVSFWMKDTLIPLDIIFMDKDYKVINIAQNTVPNQTTPTYDSTAPAQYVLEVNASWSAVVGVAPGDTISPISVQ